MRCKIKGVVHKKIHSNYKKYINKLIFLNIMPEQLSSFRIVFGNTPTVKVLDFLLEHREFDYSLTEIARNADVGWSTLYQFWPGFVKLGLVKKTRNIGRATLYKLDEKNSLVKGLIELDRKVSEVMVEKELSKRSFVKVKH
ncbi:hypothetical protein A3K72_03925 [Candidatus Woesearchaeota archaeon RBG_13_36_6]|nr:MAG: hypothetical protein A3K72_03925 [Candidatus Woesearchaeota archaeon RBG_13_36_6]